MAHSECISAMHVVISVSSCIVFLNIPLNGTGNIRQCFLWRIIKTYVLILLGRQMSSICKAEEVHV